MLLYFLYCIVTCNVLRKLLTVTAVPSTSEVVPVPATSASVSAPAPAPPVMELKLKPEPDTKVSGARELYCVELLRNKVI